MDPMYDAQDEIARLKQEVERLQKQIVTQQSVANLPQSLIDNLEFITDLARYAEGLFTEQQVKKKHHFDDATWARLGEDEALIEKIEAEKTRRIRSGVTARERAQQHFATVPNVLGDILNDSSSSPRHRIEAAREIRQVAANEAENKSSDRFVINIDLGEDYKLMINKPRKSGLDDDGKIIEGTTSPTAITDQSKDDWRKW